MARPTLIVFARAPAIGVGKSRLARDVGRVEAWRLYRRFLDGLLRRLRDPRWRLVVRVSPDGARLAFPAQEAQGEGDLGERLERAIRAHARGPVAVIGADAPDIDRAAVARAFAAARRTGAAIGPAADGGFWILALSPRRARSIRFPGVRWSTVHTATDALEAIGGEVARLETRIDVDDRASLAAWLNSRRRTPGSGSPRPPVGPA